MPFLHETAESDDETVLAVRGTALKLIADIQLELDGTQTTLGAELPPVVDPASATGLPG